MLLEISAVAGFIGVGISIVAYLPQIIHLIKEHCSAGISRMAFGMWVISSALVTFHAVVIFDYVFIVLGCIQIITSLIIYIFGKIYQNSVCTSHKLATIAAEKAETTKS